MGNPGVFQAHPHPHPPKTHTHTQGMGFYGFGCGFCGSENPWVEMMGLPMGRDDGFTHR
jgi:hypothetical protein